VDTALTPLNAKLNVTGLNLASTASSILPWSRGIVDLDANLSSQGGEAETKGNAKLSKHSWSQAVIGGSSCDGDFARSTISARTPACSIHRHSISQRVAHLSGTFQSRGRNHRQCQG